jgi:hypothetical protein
MEREQVITAAQKPATRMPSNKNFFFILTSCKMKGTA